IEYNEEHGIFVCDTARAQVTSSTIQGHRLSGIVLLDNAQVVITGSTISENGDGIVVVDSAQAAIDGNEIINNRDYGVALYQQPCNDTDEVFTGHVTGRANSIPGPDEPDGNRKGAICPTPKLDFLITEEGGEYP
ncbi:right-handed parallel beta-helix repeat-containing protein, partial [Candidatus Bipolaricaulota bacterium]|nr:right-handed parallel beta-helix repeat-containing protein [Candidatus Bipolaricaulota bacterium]